VFGIRWLFVGRDLQDVVDQPEVFCPARIHPVVKPGRIPDFPAGFSGCPGQQGFELRLQSTLVGKGGAQVIKSPSCKASWLMDHDPAVRQDVSVLRVAAGQQHGSHARGVTDAIGKNRRGDMSHDIDDGQAGNHAAAGRKDLHVDRPARGVGFVGEQFENDLIRERRSDRFAYLDDSLSRVAIGFIGRRGWVVTQM